MVIPEAAFEEGARAFPVLAGLEDPHRRLVTSEGALVRLDGGELMFDVGSECEGLGLVLEGSVRVSRISEGGREIVLYRVRPGETCTITASCLVSRHPYTARGFVEQETSGLVLPRKVFNRLVEESSPFRSFVLGVFTSRIDHLMELVNEVAFNKLDVRLASRLLELGPVLHRTHQELADEIGSTREMVSRILESFADRGLVALGRKRVEILDAQRLRSELSGR